MIPMNLSDLIVSEGFEFMIDPHPDLLDTAMGNAGSGAHCCVQRAPNGKYAIACIEDSIDYVYSASHEIAELGYGFKHTADMFSMQANILARWCKMLSTEGAR